MFRGISAAFGSRPYACLPEGDSDEGTLSVPDTDSQSATASYITDTESQTHGELPRYRVCYTQATSGSTIEKNWYKTKVETSYWVPRLCPMLRSWQESFYVFYSESALTGEIEAQPTRHKVPTELAEMFKQYRMVKDRDVVPVDGNIYRYMAFFTFGTLDTRYQQDCTEAAIEAAREHAVQDEQDPDEAEMRETKKEEWIDGEVSRAAKKPESEREREHPEEAGKKVMRRHIAIEYAMQRAREKARELGMNTDNVTIYVEKARDKEIKKQNFIDSQLKPLKRQGRQDESDRLPLALKWARDQALEAGEDAEKAEDEEKILQEDLQDLAKFAADEDRTDEIFRLPRPCYQFIILHLGLCAVILLQIVTPTCLLWFYVRNFFKGFNKPNRQNGNFRAWRTYDEMDWMVVLVGYVFLLAIQLSTFIKLASDSRSGKLVRTLARGLNEMREPVYVTWLILDALINSFVAVSVSLAAFFLIFKTRSVDDIILNSVGLLFLNHVDDAASEFQFLNNVWDPHQMGRYLIAVANTKIRGKTHAKEVNKNWLFRLYEHLPEFIYGITKLLLFVCLICGVASIVLLASRYNPARELPGDDDGSQLRNQINEIVQEHIHELHARSSHNANGRGDHHHGADDYFFFYYYYY